MSDYRKIYKSYHGFIPTDEFGRTYDIYHIDGDRTNNNLNNLLALSIQEHYNLHWAQKDYGACWLISRKMKLTPEELSALSKLVQKIRIDNKTHHFTSSKWQSDNQKMIVEKGTHLFLGGEIQRKVATRRSKNKSLPAQIASDNGTHNWFGGTHQRKVQKDRIDNGTHNWLGGEAQRKIQLARSANGTHHFLGGGPNNIKVSCLTCKKETTLPGLGANHKHDGSKRKKEKNKE
jgi:hypothetical protein